MDFEFTEDQGLLRDSVRRLLAREYTFERRQKILASTHGFSRRVWRALARRGIFNLGLPENVGGYGGPIEIMLVMEELGRSLVLEPFVSTVVVGGSLITTRGTVAQRAMLLPKIATGECRIAVAHQEVGSRYVLDRVGTVALRARGAYLLTGSKAAVLDAPIADLLIVSARDDAAGGLSLFLVDPNTPGLSYSSYRTLDGRSAAHISLQSVKVPSSARLGTAGFALSPLEQAADCEHAAVCAEAVGVMDAIVDLARSAMQHRVTDMFLMNIQARSMSYLAALRCRGADRQVRRRALAATKSFLLKATTLVARQTAPLQESGTPAGAMIVHYSRRLAAISATLGHEDPEPGSSGELLRVRVS
jgi:alkylation response protein AidB-like acyl-CoA dehydrogenase